MIEFDHVSKRYEGSRDALHDINFTLGRGEMAFLTGHSGAGKSSLLRLIALIERPSSGRLSVYGKDLSKVKPRQVPFLRRNVGIVFQDHCLLDDRTVFDNVALPLIVSGQLEYAEMARRVRAALDKVGLLDKEKMNPQHLSGGEKQRVGIARAVVNRPSLLLADEPTGNLDPQLSEEIMTLFQQFNQVGVSVMIASHDMALISRMRKRVLTLKDGRLIDDRVLV
ncbi:MAG: cell division ATP-binding protein FtsE [Gammaproteobacteria bacterium]|nr:cell division ATP-binding protein FtsE [Gammaproteobacteria bacterium]PCH65026.1 MAG: cell division ATP-binding protein FtsE [Gammaproteobacteria bacterium]